MRPLLGLPALWIVAFGISALGGCGPANEENLGGQTSKVVPQDPNVPDLNDYGKAQQYLTEQVRKAKGAKTKSAAPKPNAASATPELPKS